MHTKVLPTSITSLESIAQLTQITVPFTSLRNINVPLTEMKLAPE
jgi:hypothetical protein